MEVKEKDLKFDKFGYAFTGSARKVMGKELCITVFYKDKNPETQNDFWIKVFYDKGGLVHNLRIQKMINRMMDGHSCVDGVAKEIMTCYPDRFLVQRSIDKIPKNLILNQEFLHDLFASRSLDCETQACDWTREFVLNRLKMLNPENKETLEHFMDTL